jgi:hypothetical protein
LLKEQWVGKNAELPYYIHSRVVNDRVATLLWMGSSPVTKMSTIHPLSGDDSLVLKMRKYPGNKCTNASGASSTFVPGECQKELYILIIVDAYNQHKVEVEVVHQYRTYFDMQLIIRHNWYLLFYWILETVQNNSLIIYRDLPAKSSTLWITLDFCLSIVDDLL